MNFAQLEYVIAVHQHKNFGKAAYACDITQATLSAMIKKLEVELGYQVFDRSQQPVITTEEGVLLVEKAFEILKIKDQLKHVDNSELTELEGDLKLGVIPTIANSVVALVIPDLLKDNPKLNLTLKEITTEEIKSALKKGEIDLAIAATPFEDNSFEEEVMYYEPMLVYGEGTENKQYVSTKEITENRIWLLEEGHCFRNQVSTICEIKERNKGDESFNFHANSFETLTQLVDEMGGFTLLPELYVNSLSQSKKSRTKFFKTPIPVREISLISYRLSTKKKTSAFLQKRIVQKVKPLLSTKRFKNTDLDVIGI